MNALSQLISKISRGASLNGDDMIALLLVLTMIASLTHLLTMLVTQWGDRNTTWKSLLASILVHGVCFLGLEVFEPSVTRKARAEVVPPKLPETVTEILVESDQDVKLPESGNTPIADMMTEMDVELQRLDVTSPEITATETPERTPDELESLSTAAKDITQFEERQMTELAVPTDSGELGPQQVGAEDVASDLITTYEPNSADVLTPKMTRTLPQIGRSEDGRRIDDPTGLMSAPELEFESPKQDVAMSLANISDSAITLPPATMNPQETIESRSAPIYSMQPTDGSGLTQNVLDPKNGAASSFQARLPRPARTTPDRTPAERPSRMTPDRARTMTPLNSTYDDVRVGDVAPQFSEALESAAALVEADLPTVRRRENPPATYQLRSLATRRDAALRFGGTRESENAVERSLRWLAACQSADGHWDAEDYGAGQVKIDEIGVDRQYAGREADTGLTALVILSFLGAGYTHEDGRYALQVDHALNWLIRQQQPDGNLFGNSEHFAKMYCHAMATYALAEAYGMQQDTVLGPIVNPALIRAPNDAAALAGAVAAAGATSQSGLLLLAVEPVRSQMVADKVASSFRLVDDLRLRAALARAVAFTIGRQDPKSGGWRYRELQEGDVSMFGWQMMSLKSAEIAGVFVPSKVRQRMDDFLNSVRQGKDGGLFGYRRNVVSDGKDSEPVSPTMTAEALFCQQMLGYPQESASNQESVAYLMRNTPRLSDLNYYYWYYGTLAMYQHGGRAWQDWNSTVREVLISEQVTSGKNAGSWAPKDQWGRYGGRLYSTALATLTLEVYYRFLPLYRMNDKQEIKVKVD
jgi:hypothetical protein